MSKPAPNHKPPVLVIVGPTAAGKSALALKLAKKLKGEIISADSMQVYRGMDIGTAKPSRRERLKVPHHVIDCVSPARSFSVYAYQKKALKAVQDVTRRGRLPVVAGGTGFYIKALLDGLAGYPGEDKRLRRQYEKIIREKGLEVLAQRLKSRDPETFASIDTSNPRRVIRALEIVETSGGGRNRMQPAQKGLRALGYEPLVVGVTRERKVLYQAIEKRVDRMFRRGLVREVRKLSRRPWSVTARQAVGYKEVREVLKARNGDLSQAKERIKRNTRRFAKRQLTWFRKEKPDFWVPVHNAAELKEAVQKISACF